MLIKIIICLIIGYVFGCFSTGYFVGKANNIDIRSKGSGNAGATNTLRTLGWKAGLTTLLGDAFKAAIPILVFRLFLYPNMENIETIWQVYGLYIALGVTLGHNFPFYLNFKGGKGIAVFAGTIIGITDWKYTLIAASVFVVIVYFTRYVSLGSLIVVWALPIYITLFLRDTSAFIHMLILSLIFVVLAYVRHSGNIQRLLTGTERKLGASKE